MGFLVFWVILLLLWRGEIYLTALDDARRGKKDEMGLRIDAYYLAGTFCSF